MKNEADINNIVVAVNILVFSIKEGCLQALLVKRRKEPYFNFWLLPGGVIKDRESFEKAADRVLFEKTGVRDIYLEQLYTFGDPDRDPRERRIAVTYYALVPSESLKLGESAVKDANWFPVKKLPKLAFDHSRIVSLGLERLKGKVGYSNVVFGLLREEFPLRELQRAYEIILDKKFDKRNFRKKMQELGLLEKTGKTEMEGAHRPAMLYKFKNKEVVFF